MKFLNYVMAVVSIGVCAGCDDKEDVAEVFMQPASITTEYSHGTNQRFSYDDYGRITEWRSETGPSRIVADYSYPQDGVIYVESSDENSPFKRIYTEKIYLENGRAVYSEGTFISITNSFYDIQKTYRLFYNYDAANHLVSVKHAEVMGIGDEIKDDAWDNAWEWENYYIWEDGNLTEYQDYEGNSYVRNDTEYAYYGDRLEYPVISPIDINCFHHKPLAMQGVFGSNPVNMLASVTTSYKDKWGNVNSSKTYKYTYQYDGNMISGYCFTKFYGYNADVPILYNIEWTEMFRPVSGTQLK